MRFKNLLVNHLHKLLLGSLLCSSSVFADKHVNQFDIGEINCWDYTALEDSDRATAASMVFGFVAAKKDMPIQSGTSIKTTIEYATKLCVSNPDMYVSTAIERGLSKLLEK